MRDAPIRTKACVIPITAYNHGRSGMLRARSLHGSDMAEIMRKYKGRTFKYASKNFYPEFLAAVRVYQNYERYFGPLTLDQPLDFSDAAVRLAARAPRRAATARGIVSGRTTRCRRSPDGMELPSER